MESPTESAVLVPIPAVEPVVAEHRRRLDPGSAWGVPAHVTVLYPFVPPSEHGPEMLERLAEVVGSVPTFSCSFTGPAWFNDHVVWLRPAPDTSFRALTDAVWRSFPDYPPFGGVHDDVVVEPSRAGEGATEGRDRPHHLGQPSEHRGSVLARGNERIEHRDVGRHAPCRTWVQPPSMLRHHGLDRWDRDDDS